MSNKHLSWTAVIISIAVIAIHNIAIHPWMLDDSFISFRYAENFSSGQGLVFNPGERVEGYTSFLWVALLASGKTVGFDIILLSKLLGTVFGIGCVLLLVDSHRFVGNIDRTVPAIAGLFLGTCGIFTPWATSGMEVTMFTFLVLLSILLALSTRGILNDRRRACLLGVICGVTAMTRPEGTLIFAVILMDRLILTLKNRNGAVLCLAVAFSVVYLPYFAWRYSYYGYLLPNTFYGKVGFSVYQVIRGAEYLMHFALPALLLLIPVLVSIFSLRWSRRFGGLNLLLLAAGIYALYIVLVGGDSMPAFRFFAPIMPVLCLTAALSISSLAKAKKIIAFVGIGVVLYNIAQMRINDQIYHHIISDEVALQGREGGLWLRANARPDALIATNTAGSIPYFSKLRTIDMLGMNDSHIAHREIPSLGKGWAGHEKGDGSYVLWRSPDYIQLGPGLGSVYPFFLGDHEIYGNPVFHKRYSLKVYRLESGNSLVIYEKKPGGD